MLDSIIFIAFKGKKKVFNFQFWLSDETGAILVSSRKASSLSPKCFSLGIEGTVWTELIRTADQLDSMIFPRLLAVAERAWNKAPWADNAEYAARQRAIDSEWVNFANTLGYKELMRLDLMGVAYRIPPPEPR